MKVTLFATCLVDMFHSNVGKATVELLEKLGCEIEFPQGQICCGQPAYNSGYVKDAKQAMKHMITVFEQAEYIVTPSGSCATMFKEYPHILKDEPDWQHRAQLVANKTYELTQFIVQVLKREDLGATLNGKATVHTSCHMTRLLGAKSEPFTLLNNVQGLEVIPLDKSQDCCGFGGTFSVKMGQISEQMVDEKVSHIEDSKADFLIGADCGCLMNIKGRIDRKKSPVTVLHIAEVLNSQ
ncbi:(Fe-S)-binding protein [Jeotgalibacillus soli]|uniref:Lactate utilization protein A n=1 Tax=Jeotgalibacillus soli TaxID=889306 RepID=A0A0C2W5M4_9BACL|nr:(Fe-S)-binding protein [Jeotgalibacillus soli]KIL51881.1 lactate utilization protein A [Jeotgalibacillus soli]